MGIFVLSFPTTRAKILLNWFSISVELIILQSSFKNTNVQFWNMWFLCVFEVSLMWTLGRHKGLFRPYVVQYVQWISRKHHASPGGITFEIAMLIMWHFVLLHKLTPVICEYVDHWYRKWKKCFLAPKGPVEQLMSGSMSSLGCLVLRWVRTQEESSIGTYWGQIQAYQTTNDSGTR